VARVQAPSRGAVASFLGLVRDHHQGQGVERLEYSAYEPMAESEIDCIVSEASHRWNATVAVEHRLGTLEIGDVAVAVAVATPHRGDALDACRYVIEELKQRVPIWKREHYADGSVGWVDQTEAPAS
jgi:molybdopterin synthase catalytic subunit